MNGARESTIDRVAVPLEEKKIVSRSWKAEFIVFCPIAAVWHSCQVKNFNPYSNGRKSLEYLAAFGPQVRHLNFAARSVRKILMRAGKPPILDGQFRRIPIASFGIGLIAKHKKPRTISNLQNDARFPLNFGEWKPCFTG